MENQPLIEHAIHQLAQAEKFQQKHLEGFQHQMYHYYWTLDQCYLLNSSSLPLMYPLPPVLHINPSQTEEKCAANYAHSDRIQARQRVWTQSTSLTEKWNEERGLILSKFTQECQQQNKEHMEKKTSSE